MLDELGFVKCLNPTPLALHGPDVAFRDPLKMTQLSQLFEEHPSPFIFSLAPHLGLSLIPGSPAHRVSWLLPYTAFSE